MFQCSLNTPLSASPRRESTHFGFTSLNSNYSICDLILHLHRWHSRVICRLFFSWMILIGLSVSLFCRARTATVGDNEHLLPVVLQEETSSGSFDYTESVFAHKWQIRGAAESEEIWPCFLNASDEPVAQQSYLSLSCFVIFLQSFYHPVTPSPLLFHCISPFFCVLSFSSTFLFFLHLLISYCQNSLLFLSFRFHCCSSVLSLALYLHLFLSLIIYLSLSSPAAGVAFRCWSWNSVGSPRSSSSRWTRSALEMSTSSTTAACVSTTPSTGRRSSGRRARKSSSAIIETQRNAVSCGDGVWFWFEICPFVGAPSSVYSVH